MKKEAVLFVITVFSLFSLAIGANIFYSIQHETYVYSDNYNGPATYHSNRATGYVVAPTSDTCYDSDGGVIIDEFGAARITHDDNSHNDYPDECQADGRSVKEFYCATPNQQASRIESCDTITCSAGEVKRCNSGACECQVASCTEVSIATAKQALADYLTSSHPVLTEDQVGMLLDAVLNPDGYCSVYGGAQIDSFANSLQKVQDVVPKNIGLIF